MRIKSRIAVFLLALCAYSANGSAQNSIISIDRPNARGGIIEVRIFDPTTGNSKTFLKFDTSTRNENLNNARYNPANNTISIRRYSIINSKDTFADTYDATSGKLLSSIRIQDDNSSTAYLNDTIYKLPDTSNIATNTTNIATNTGDIASLSADLSKTNEKVDENTEGVALALAMVGGLTLPDGNTYAISGNWGTFEGENAIAFGAIARVSNNVFVTGGIGGGLSNGTVGGRAGITFSQ